MTLEETEREIKEEQKKWARRFIIWIPSTLFVGISLFLSRTNISLTIILSVLLTYCIMILSISIKALIECHNWKKDIKGFRK